MFCILRSYPRTCHSVLLEYWDHRCVPSCLAKVVVFSKSLWLRLYSVLVDTCSFLWSLLKRLSYCLKQNQAEHPSLTQPHCLFWTEAAPLSIEYYRGLVGAWNHCCTLSLSGLPRSLCHSHRLTKQTKKLKIKSIIISSNGDMVGYTIAFNK